jgi:hypothetical protein
LKNGVVARLRRRFFSFIKLCSGFQKKQNKTKKKPTPLYYFFAILMFFIFIFKKERENTKNKVAKKNQRPLFQSPLSLSLPFPKRSLKVVAIF